MKIYFYPVIGLFICSCNFDEERQKNMLFPNTLAIHNQCNQLVHIKTIYNSSETDSGFLLKGARLKIGERFELKVSDSVLLPIKSRHFYISGECGAVNDWELKGNSPKIITNQDSSDAIYSIKLMEC